MTERIGLSWPAEAQKIVLGGIEIDLRYRVVRRVGVAHELNPRTFDLLSLFLREPRVLHTREAIFAKIWPGVIVEDASLTTCVWMLRRAFGNDAKQWIRTVSKQGYVFDPPCEIRLVEGDAGAAPTDIVDPLALLDAADDVDEPAFVARPRAQRWAKVAVLRDFVAPAPSEGEVRVGATVPAKALRDDIEQRCSEGLLVAAIDAVGRAALH
jgi:DNA-binding winged helix-turn-helix (wHTH) protein